MTGYRIEFEPIGKRVLGGKGETLLSSSRRSGVGINSVCGGKGLCKACRVRVLSGEVSSPEDVEREVFSPRELDEGWRLACRVLPLGDVKVYIPPGSMTTGQRLQVEGKGVNTTPDPCVQVLPFNLSEPDREDPRGEADRLLSDLKKMGAPETITIGYHTLRDLRPLLRSSNHKGLAVLHGEEITAVLPPGRRPLGLAVDLGTTKIAGYLLDLREGERLAAEGIPNPQVAYGEDVITRLAHCLQSPRNGMVLREETVEAVNELAGLLCRDAGEVRENIVEAVVVGNTVMHHFFLGLPVDRLARAPFTPALSGPLDVKARDLGLRLSSGAWVHFLPNIAGFVGGDHVAMLLSTEAWREEGPAIALDVGTNTEVSLVHNGKIFTVSCASGPAFEGGHIRHGMRAAKGAIERVFIGGDGVHVQTVDDAPPTGICGSGIVEAVARLFQAGIVDEGGRMRKDHPLVQEANGERAVVLAPGGEDAPDIAVTQRDVREVQLAKAAVQAGIRVLLDESGCSCGRIRKVIMAGAFGTYLDLESAVVIGMLPCLPLNRFHQVGNAAGTGACLALLSRARRREARKIASLLKYVELATHPRFQSFFLQAIRLGEFDSG
jgi:uncharacterized 2Fe-2S/4Fe-4S cluster protein (DUF4445 family)